MIDKLLDQMTLAEQVSLLSGADFWTTNAVERLGIPKIKVSDGPNGARGGGSFVGGITAAAFPCAISIGSSWDPELAREIGGALADEARSKGASVLLAPTVNIHRSGLNGRNFECYSEDPHLSAELAVGYIEGLQAKGVAATIKHFVANESEFERFTISSDVGERALRELYLPPFEAAVKRANVRAIMSSYNQLNGTFTSEHPWLLTTVLRAEWGYGSIVMSDWFGSHSTAETINAGLDLEMPGPARDRGDKLVAAVENGDVKPETVRASAKRMLELIQWVGAFENPGIAEEKADNRPEHRALIRRAGAEGTVLLKNNGILPLAKAKTGTIAALGPNAAVARIMGGGSAQINAHYKVSPLDGLKNALQGSNAIFHATGVDNRRLIKLYEGDVSVDYFNSVDLTGPVVDGETFDIAENLWLDPKSDAFDIHNFSARMRFTFTPEEDGEHVLSIISAGRSRLYVDDILTIENWDDWVAGENYFSTGNNEKRHPMMLKAGKPVKIMAEYRTPLPGDVPVALQALRIGVEKLLDEDALEKAVETAASCDVAIICAGREGEWDSEGHDLPDMRLPGHQDALISRVAAANKNTIVVLQTGGPVEMPWLDDVAAVLQAWYPGQEAGNAIADVLFGEAEPGGRLPQTFPLKLSDNSAFTGDASVYPGKDGHVRYEEGVFVGYRHHDTRKIKTLFPFGFGLSYTGFAWSDATLSAESMSDQGLVATVKITNTGNRAGSDVVQLYVRAKNSGVERPEKELRAFAKVHLKPGETKTALLMINPRSLSYFDEGRKAFVSEAGDYEAIIASNAETIKAVLPFRLEAEWMEHTTT